MRLLLLGDIIGASGMRAVVTSLRSLQREHRADLVIANAENAADGFGVTAELAEQLFRSGVAVLTTGNHVWHDEKVVDLLANEPRVLRPHNYPGGSAGSGLYIVTHAAGRVAVLNLQGRDRLGAIDDPFRTLKTVLKANKGAYDLLVVDFHAESTHEKEALAHMIDGKATVVYGTHTHVQTADDRILPRGTAYITDIGACLPVPSVIGFNPEISVRRALTQLPIRNEVASGPAWIHGLLVEAGGNGVRATAVHRIRYRSLV